MGIFGQCGHCLHGLFCACFAQFSSDFQFKLSYILDISFSALPFCPSDSFFFPFLSIPALTFSCSLATFAKSPSCSAFQTLGTKGKCKHKSGNVNSCLLVSETAKNAKAYCTHLQSSPIAVFLHVLINIFQLMIFFGSSVCYYAESD